MRISSTLQDPSFRAVVARTTELPDADKFSYWNDVICRTVVDLDCRPIQQRNFEASIEGFETPEIGVYHIHTQPHLVYRSASEIARLDNDALVINFVTSGTLYSEQDSRGVLLQAGDAAISDAARPYFLRFDDPLGCVSVKINKSVLSERILDYSKFTASSMIAGSALTTLTFDYMNSMLKLASSLNEGAAMQASHIFRDLLSATVEQLVSNTSNVGSAKKPKYKSVALLQVKNFVESKLSDPRLDVATVSRATQLSARYINKLFEAEDTSLGRYIWGKRLDRCAALLRDPRQCNKDISAIAYQSGFNDISHFSRAFKARFGKSPRDFRQTRLL
jgi:AraC family transcriptional regulator, positive regulator of tynA and feaB